MFSVPTLRPKWHTTLWIKRLELLTEEWFIKSKWSNNTPNWFYYWYLRSCGRTVHPPRIGRPPSLCYNFWIVLNRNTREVKRKLGRAEKKSTSNSVTMVYNRGPLEYHINFSTSSFVYETPQYLLNNFWKLTPYVAYETRVHPPIGVHTRHRSFLNDLFHYKLLSGPTNPLSLIHHYPYTTTLLLNICPTVHTFFRFSTFW